MADRVPDGVPDPVQACLDTVADAGRRAALLHLREVVLSAAPDAVPVLSYRLPAWRVSTALPGVEGPGGVVCGFAVTASGWSYYPFSGSVVTAFAGRLEGWGTTKGSIHVPVVRPLPDDLVVDMIAFRRREIAERGR